MACNVFVVVGDGSGCVLELGKTNQLVRGILLSVVSVLRVPLEFLVLGKAVLGGGVMLVGELALGNSSFIV